MNGINPVFITNPEQAEKMLADELGESLESNGNQEEALEKKMESLRNAISRNSTVLIFNRENLPQEMREVEKSASQAGLGMSAFSIRCHMHPDTEEEGVSLENKIAMAIQWSLAQDPSLLLEFIGKTLDSIREEMHRNPVSWN